MNWTQRLGKWLVVGTVVSVTTVGVGCLTRPVGTQPPTTKVNFTSTVSQAQVDKVDLLFMIDNSSSMGDKQKILADAVPNLLSGLLEPQCVDVNGKAVGKTANPNGSKADHYGCPADASGKPTDPEFPPVTDMHIGLISSSLGSFGGDVCPDGDRRNDKGRLLNISAAGPLAEASPSNFLSWYPTNADNGDKKRHPDPPTPPVTDLNALTASFQKLVVGVGQNGCGLEAQLESFYRFLIQPDPWVKVVLDDAQQAYLGADTDVDVELLKQRADFLREDSLVAIIELTDEDDSSSDPLSVGGQGWAFMSNQFPGSPNFRTDGKSTTAPRGTSICATNPGADGKDGKVACTSCGFAATCNAADPACQLIKNDPECANTGGYYGGDQDALNVRFHRMKERYGIDPQYPIRRYVDGLKNTRVPDRSTEHPSKLRDPSKPLGGREIQPYVGTAKCTNPLFAKNLPREAGAKICDLTRSTRSPDLIFFAVVGGVPNKLLHFKANDAEASRIQPADWIPILGKSPETYDYTGIDPHMIQSIAPRANVPPPSTDRGNNGDGSDTAVGRDWTTNGNDLQYACTFDLPKELQLTGCTPTSGCDCADVAVNPPLCGKTPGTQLKAKAYPTAREFMVVRALGNQGVIASLCPISLTVDKKDPTYGYNPAVSSIIDRLKNALTTQCLPQRLQKSSEPADQGQVPCLVLAQLGDPTDKCDGIDLTTPEPAIYAKFLEQKKAESGDTSDGGVDLSKRPVCVLKQLVVAAGETCKADPSKGWCYVENSATGTPAGRCPQALLFSQATATLQGAEFSLQCIQQFSADAGSN